MNTHSPNGSGWFNCIVILFAQPSKSILLLVPPEQHKDLPRLAAVGDFCYTSRKIKKNEPVELVIMSVWVIPQGAHTEKQMCFS